MFKLLEEICFYIDNWLYDHYYMLMGLLYLLAALVVIGFILTIIVLIISVIYYCFKETKEDIKEINNILKDSQETY